MIKGRSISIQASIMFNAEAFSADYSASQRDEWNLTIDFDP